MANRPARAPIDRLATASETPFEEEAVICFKNGQAGVEPLALRDHDDVESRGELIPTENLSY
jgi:hypothetical protein